MKLFISPSKVTQGHGLLIRSPGFQQYKRTLLLLVTSASNLPMHIIKCYFVVFGVTLRLLVINTLSSVRLLRTTKLMTPLIVTSDECHQLATVRRSCVYNIWRSNRWHHPMKPDIDRESRFFSIPHAVKAPLGGSPPDYCYNVWYIKKLECCGYPMVKKI